MSRKEKRSFIIKVTLVISIVILLILLPLSYMVVQYMFNLRLSHIEDLVKMTEQINKKDNQISELIKYIDLDKDTAIKELSDVVSELEEELIEVSDTNKSLVDELKVFREREELYDKYEYCIFDETGERTELTYSQIKLGEELMEENGYDPNLLLGTIMVESRGNPDAYNESSGAAGYGQLMNTTAEYLWEDVMGLSDYNPQIRYDGDANIYMMAEYYNYLYKNGYDTFRVVKQYSGNLYDYGAYEYLSKINSYTKQCGVTIQ